MNLFLRLMIIILLESTAHCTLFWGQFHTNTLKTPYVILPLKARVYVWKYIKLFLHFILNSVYRKKLTQNILFISLYHLSTTFKKNWILVAFWIVKTWSHFCLYKPKNLRYMYHTNMGQPLGRVFSTTTKYSPHFKWTLMMNCLLVTVTNIFLNLFINHTVMFILVIWIW